MPFAPPVCACGRVFLSIFARFLPICRKNAQRQTHKRHWLALRHKRGAYLMFGRRRQKNGLKSPSRFAILFIICRLRPDSERGNCGSAYRYRAVALAVANFSPSGVLGKPPATIINRRRRVFTARKTRILPVRYTIACSDVNPVPPQQSPCVVYALMAACAQRTSSAAFQPFVRADQLRNKGQILIHKAGEYAFVVPVA